jgi:spore coat protein U-like protein
MKPELRERPVTRDKPVIDLKAGLMAIRRSHDLLPGVQRLDKIVADLHKGVSSMQKHSKQVHSKASVIAALVVAASFASGGVIAATATSNLPVSATVAASCTIDASAGIAFGTYDPVVTNASTDLAATGSLSTTCTNGFDSTVTLGQGANADSGSTDASPLRRMLSGTTDFLSYQLYTDAGNTTVWDNTTGATVTGTGAPVTTNVYGVIAAGQNVPVGSYADTVVATVSF